MIMRPILSHYSVVVFVLLFAAVSNSISLSTNSRWIIDSVSGRRVKLMCANWAGHMDAMLVEGLDKRPLQDIVGQVVSLGFNCVRLTWATYMYTNPDYIGLTVSRSLDSLNLSNAKMGIEKNNPTLLGYSLIQAQNAVVDELGRQGVMVVLDNHVSKPKWCCGNNDGNGFFGDTFFDPNEWTRGLDYVAKLYKGKSQVVAISLRNELRGPRQNENDWYKYMEMGARQVHESNPDVLVIVSGLNYDLNLSFLKNRPLGTNLDNKLVYEAHWYSFSGGQWESQPLNQVCDQMTRSFNDRAGFLLSIENPVPLFLSEFGVDQRGVNRRDNRFLTCFMACAADLDLDWALWAFQGSYYMKNDQIGPDETYGVMDFDWVNSRNPKFLERYRLIQKILREPGSNTLEYNIMYHPESGHCIRRIRENNLEANDCREWSQWTHAGDGEPVRLKDTSLCLKATGDNHPVIISDDCSNPLSQWKYVSRSKLQIVAQDEQGSSLCLQAKSTNSSILFTMKCICLGDDKCLTNPQSQWFKFVSSNL